MKPQEQPPSRRRLLALTPFLAGLALAAGEPTAVAPLELLTLVVLLLLSGFFSAAETAITALWPWKIKELAKKEGPGSPFALLERDITRFLTTILVGNNLVNIAATALVTDIATKLYGSAGVGIATGVMTALVLFFGEITPKSLAVHHADRLARIVVRPIYWLSVLLYPVGRFFSWTSSLILRLVGLEPRTEPLVTEEELKLILAGAERSGAIEEEEEDMIKGVLELEETQVKEIMVPRVEIVAIEAQASLKEFLDLVREHRFSRYPVYKESIDHVTGVAIVKDLLDYVEDDQLERVRVEAIAHEPYFVPESMSVWDLLVELRKRKFHMAIVVDEFGGTAGLVTLEDIIEEIVGDIYDETDELEESIQELPGGGLLVEGQVSLDDLAERLGVEFPEGDYETLSGFLYEQFGRIPETGEAIEWNGLRFVVAEADRRRIRWVKIERLEKRHEDAQGEG